MNICVNGSQYIIQFLTCYIYVSDGKRGGVHWALLAIDLNDHKVYYGDSLGWSLPTNIADTVVPNLKKIEDDLGIDITYLLKNIMTIENAGVGLTHVNDSIPNSLAQMYVVLWLFVW